MPSWRVTRKASLSNQITHFGIMGGLSNSRVATNTNRATNTLRIPKPAATGLQFMQMHNLLSKNPQGSGGVGRMVKSKPCNCTGLEETKFEHKYNMTKEDFYLADTNNDGKLTQEEYYASNHQEDFDKIDKNNDGYITIDEVDGNVTIDEVDGNVTIDEVNVTYTHEGCSNYQYNWGGWLTGPQIGNYKQGFFCCNPVDGSCSTEIPSCTTGGSSNKNMYCIKNCSNIECGGIGGARIWTSDQIYTISPLLPNTSFHGNPVTIASGGTNGNIRLWDINNDNIRNTNGWATIIKTLNPSVGSSPNPSIQAITTLNPGTLYNGKAVHIATGDEAGNIHLWDVSAGVLVASFPASCNDFETDCFSALRDLTTLNANAFYKGTPMHLASAHMQIGDPINSVGYIKLWNFNVKLTDTDSSAVIHAGSIGLQAIITLPPNSLCQGQPVHLATGGWGRPNPSVYSGGIMCLWDISNGTKVKCMVSEGGGAGNNIRALTLLYPNTLYKGYPVHLASGDGGNTNTIGAVRLWDISNAIQRAYMTDEKTAAVCSITTLHNGNIAAGGCEAISSAGPGGPQCVADPNCDGDKGCKVCDPSGGQGKVPKWSCKWGSCCPGYTEFPLVDDCGNSLGNYCTKLVETTSSNIWNVNTGKLMHTLFGSFSWVNAIVTLPDGNLISTASDGTDGGYAQYWPMGNGERIPCINNQEGEKLSGYSFESPNGNLYCCPSGNYDNSGCSTSENVCYINSPDTRGCLKNRLLSDCSGIAPRAACAVWDGTTDIQLLFKECDVVVITSDLSNISQTITVDKGKTLTAVGNISFNDLSGGTGITINGEANFNNTISFKSINNGVGIIVNSSLNSFPNVSFGDISDSIGIDIYGSGNNFNNVSFGTINGGHGIIINNSSNNFSNVSFGTINNDGQGIMYDNATVTFSYVSFGYINNSIGINGINNFLGSGTFTDVSFGDINNSIGINIDSLNTGTFKDNISFSYINNSSSGISINGSGTFEDKISFGYISNNSSGIIIDGSGLGTGTFKDNISFSGISDSTGISTDGSGTFTDVSFGYISNNSSGIIINYTGSGTFKDNISFSDISDSSGIIINGSGTGTFEDKISFDDINDKSIGISIDGSGTFTDVSFSDISNSSGIIINFGGSGTFKDKISFSDINNSSGIIINFRGSGTFKDKISFSDINNSSGIIIDGSGTFEDKISFSNINNISSCIRIDGIGTFTDVSFGDINNTKSPEDNNKAALFITATGSGTFKDKISVGNTAVVVKAYMITGVFVDKNGEVYFNNVSFSDIASRSRGISIYGKANFKNSVNFNGTLGGVGIIAFALNDMDSILNDVNFEDLHSDEDTDPNAIAISLRDLSSGRVTFNSISFKQELNKPNIGIDTNGTPSQITISKLCGEPSTLVWSHSPNDIHPCKK